MPTKGQLPGYRTECCGNCQIIQALMASIEIILSNCYANCLIFYVFHSSGNAALHNRCLYRYVLCSWHANVQSEQQSMFADLSDSRTSEYSCIPGVNQTDLISLLFNDNAVFFLVFLLFLLFLSLLIIKHFYCYSLTNDLA